jgi:hypothetical protein
MAVELDVANPRGLLSPGMYPTVAWPVRRRQPALVVPVASVATTTERAFVIRIRDGVVQWVTVTKGQSAGPDLIEITGALAPGDRIAKRATDELREGTHVTAK